MNNNILAGKEVTFEDLVYFAGNTPSEAKEVTLEFFRKMSVSKENSEKAQKRAQELKEEDPRYFEEL